MNRAVIINRIRSIRETLNAAGVLHLWLFGSVARDEADEHSDVDCAIDLTPEARPSFTLLDRSHISILLEDALGLPVDVLVRADMRNVRADFERDAFQVF
jgi:hypothetical protein